MVRGGGALGLGLEGIVKIVKIVWGGPGGPGGAVPLVWGVKG